jgi:hypothetical protein
METVQRKPRLLFRMEAHPPCVTFDDGKDWRRNLPWLRYAGSTWSYADPDVIRVEIDEWLVVLAGHNLEPLFAAIEGHTLASIRPHTEWTNTLDRERDSFVTSIRFVRVSALTPQAKQKMSNQTGPRPQ